MTQTLTPPPPSSLVTIPRFPPGFLRGLCKDFAVLYAEHLEPPLEFFYFSSLTFLGAILSRHVTLDTELNVQPRLYTTLLGESAEARKSTTNDKAAEFFDPWVKSPNNLRLLLSVDSGEGLVKFFEGLKGVPAILHLDEFKSLIDKAKGETSTLLSVVNTLFEKNGCGNTVKAAQVSVHDAYFSLIAACTRETYANVFTGPFFQIGFHNRLWLVTSDAPSRRVAFPKAIDLKDIDALRQGFRERIDKIRQTVAAQRARVVYPLSPDAIDVWTHWYDSHERTLYTKRLDIYGMRLMLLLAISEGEAAVSGDVAEVVVDVLAHQAWVREQHHPINARNIYAEWEQRIRQWLKKQGHLTKERPTTRREVARGIHSERCGEGVFETCLKNLTTAGDIGRDGTAVWLTLPGATMV